MGGEQRLANLVVQRAANESKGACLGREGEEELDSPRYRGGTERISGRFSSSRRGTSSSGLSCTGKFTDRSKASCGGGSRAVSKGKKGGGRNLWKGLELMKRQP